MGFDNIKQNVAHHFSKAKNLSLFYEFFCSYKEILTLSLQILIEK